MTRWKYFGEGSNFESTYFEQSYIKTAFVVEIVKLIFYDSASIIYQTGRRKQSFDIIRRVRFEPVIFRIKSEFATSVSNQWIPTHFGITRERGYVLQWSRKLHKQRSVGRTNRRLSITKQRKFLLKEPIQGAWAELRFTQIKLFYAFHKESQSFSIFGFIAKQVC